MDGYQLRAIINSQTRANSAAKQRAGQAYAKMLGLTPGKSGRDDLTKMSEIPPPRNRWGMKANFVIE